MAEIQFLMASDAPAPVAPYSHAVRAGDWLFVTGQLATDPADDATPLPEGIALQTVRVMENLRLVLAACGADLAAAVMVRAFLAEFARDYAAFNHVYAGYFVPGHLPARTTVGVTALARGGLIEIDMIARL